MSKWTDVLWKSDESQQKRSEPPVPTHGNSTGSANPFPTLSIPVFSNNPPPVAPSSPTPQNVEVEAPAGEVVVDPHLEKVVDLVRSRVETLAGASYQQFNAVLERMQKTLQPNQQLDLNLVCAAVNVSGRDLVSEVAVMEQGLQTAELEVSNEIDTEEREAVSDLESEISIIDSATSSRQSHIDSLEQQLQALRSEQLGDQRTLNQKQGQLRNKKAVFNASRQRLRAARTRVAQELANQKRTFQGL